MNSTKVCECCGAKTVQYAHTLSTGLVRGFIKAVEHAAPGRKFAVSACDLTHIEAANFQKLRYWGLIERCAGNSEKGGDWLITDRGLNFATGSTSLSRKVWTYRGHVERYEGRPIWIEDILGGWKYRPQYAREALPHGQGRLF